MRRIKCLILTISILTICMCIATIGIYAAVESTGRARTLPAEALPKADCIIVPGAAVYGERVSLTLAYRLEKALELYNLGKSDKIIVSGDHGRKSYDEVNTMRDYLTARGVPAENIFMDHAGFSTYDTVYRARDVFMAKRVIIATQQLHLSRALYIAKVLGVDAYGAAAKNSTQKATAVQSVRELPARIKAFLQCRVFHSKPKYLGESIPVSGSGLVTEG